MTDKVMGMRVIWLIVGTVAVLGLGGCQQTAVVSTPEPVTLTVAGATAMQPVLRELGAAFSRQHPGVVFDLRGGGSALGEAAAAKGKADLAASTLFPPDMGTSTGSTQEQAASVTPSADDLLRTPIGLDGLAIIVHPSNPIGDLTLLELRRLYSGRIIDWSELGGPNGAVDLASREDGSGSRDLFDDRVMGEEPVSLTAVVMPTSQAVVDFVTRNPLAIGYVSRAYVADLLGDGPASAADTLGATPAFAPEVKVVAVEGALPTVDNLLAQDYALIQPLYLITGPSSTGARADWARQFIYFALSPAGQEIVGRYHARVR
jgi:phosphate transport system substrate-binding protein